MAENSVLMSPGCLQVTEPFGIAFQYLWVLFTAFSFLSLSTKKKIFSCNNKSSDGMKTLLNNFSNF